MQLETQRLILRPFELTDDQAIYEYAKDPAIGPIAGWPAHTSVAHSRELIQNYLMAKAIFAVNLKTAPNHAIGSVGLELVENGGGQPFMGANDAEIGYWIGVPYWGQGLIPEAAEKILAYGFETLKLDNIWCGYYDGNQQSKRAQEKLGFQPALTIDEMYNPLLDDTRQEHFTKMTKAQWQARHQ
ncbi:GNAT family N-acetyltransferase [Latilactobacillus curvatus]